MGRLFESPIPIIIIVVAALLLFAAPKLPAMARSLGQSARILRSEVREMKNEARMPGRASPDAQTTPNGQATEPGA